MTNFQRNGVQLGSFDLARVLRPHQADRQDEPLVHAEAAGRVRARLRQESAPSDGHGRSHGQDAIEEGYAERHCDERLARVRRDGGEQGGG